MGVVLRFFALQNMACFGFQRANSAISYKLQPEIAQEPLDEIERGKKRFDQKIEQHLYG